jgi:hypothetical protein
MPGGRQAVVAIPVVPLQQLLVTAPGAWLHKMVQAAGFKVMAPS